MATSADRRRVASEGFQTTGPYYGYPPTMDQMPGEMILPGNVRPQYSPTPTGPIVHAPSGPPQIRGTPVSPSLTMAPQTRVQGPTPLANPDFGYFNGWGWQKDPGTGRMTRIPHADPRRDITGNVLGKLIGGGITAAGGGPLGLAGGLIGGSISQGNRNRKARRNAPKDTLTKDQISGGGRASGIYDKMTSNNPNDPALAAQRAGINLGGGMEGTYLDRTVGTTAPGTTYYGQGGAFNAAQRGNQIWNDTRSPSVNEAQGDTPDHIYNGPDGELRHAMTARELNSPEMRRARNASMLSSTKQFRDRSLGLGEFEGQGPASASRGPVTRESYMDILNRARGIVPTLVEAPVAVPFESTSSIPMNGGLDYDPRLMGPSEHSPLTTAQPLTYDPRMMGPFQAGRAPVAAPAAPRMDRAQALIERYKRMGGRR